MLLRWAPLALALGACGGSAAPAVIGDVTQPIEAKLVYAGDRPVLQDLTDGGVVPLEPPPQGGYVIYVGARVRNVHEKGVQLRGQLRDPTSHAVIAFDGRTVDLVVGSDGWGAPDSGGPTSVDTSSGLYANLSNVNPCPDYTAKDVNGQPYTLELEVLDPDGRTAMLDLPIVPTCQLGADPKRQANCVCTCSANYQLGKCAAP